MDRMVIGLAGLVEVEADIEQSITLKVPTEFVFLVGDQREEGQGIPFPSSEAVQELPLGWLW